MAQVALAARQDVALAASPALGQRHETGRHVAGIDVRKPAGGVDPHEPAQVALHVPGRDAVHVAGAEQEAWVRDHDVCLRLEQALLAGPLRRRVRKAASPWQETAASRPRAGQEPGAGPTAATLETCTNRAPGSIPCRTFTGPSTFASRRSGKILRLVGDIGRPG